MSSFLYRLMCAERRLQGDYLFLSPRKRLRVAVHEEYTEDRVRAKRLSFFSFETDPKHVDTCCGETMHVRTGMIDWRLVRKTVARHASTCGGYIALCVHPVLEHCFQHALVASKGCNKKTSLRVTCGHQSEDS